MLAEKRHAIILETVNRQKSVNLSELCQLLDTSESTIRRDLTILANMGKLVKVHGGAVSIEDSFFNQENNVEEKSKLFTNEKIAIAKYSASMIDSGDFIFIDAGTTTEKMIDYIPNKDVTFVTTGFINAKRLAQRGFKVYIPGGKIKLTTEAIVGAECVLSLKNYNFTKSFVGVNGISLTSGFSTPDVDEAKVKTAVIENSRTVYILADHSKFDKITSVTFAQLNKAQIVTDRLIDKKYLFKTNIKEVL